MVRSIRRPRFASHLGALALLLALLSGCSIMGRKAQINSLESSERALREANARNERLIDTLKKSADEHLAHLDAARRERDALAEERDALQAELESREERMEELEAERDEAVAELEKARGSSGDLRSRVNELTEELEAAQARQKKLERKVETLRVCCQAPEP